MHNFDVRTANGTLFIESANPLEERPITVRWVDEKGIERENQLTNDDDVQEKLNALFAGYLLGIVREIHIEH